MVFGNVALPLNLNYTLRIDKKYVTELLELVKLVDKHEAYPASPSSRQKQCGLSPMHGSWQSESAACYEATSTLKPPARSIRRTAALFLNY